MNNEKKDKRTAADHIRSMGHAKFKQGFQHIVRLKEEDIEPTIDPETGERRSYAVIGAVKIKQR